jgi:dihydrofolate reductase
MKRTLHIATSLDGYIADTDGSITWLEQAASDPGVSARVLAYIATAEAIVMGRLTYEHVLSFGEWPHADKHTIVVSSTITVPQTPGTVIVPVEGLMQALVDCGAQIVWIVGGGQLIAHMLDQGWIDEIIVSVAPVLLGAGRPLTAALPRHMPLQLREVHQLPAGFVELTYGLPLPC